jgi:hypothetical protein
MTKVEMDNILNPIRGQVMNISRSLPTGAQYFTVAANDVDKKFAERKQQIDANPASPEIITNRGPRVIVMRGHSVVSQDFAQDVDGNSVVIFNKGQEDETKAPIIVSGSQSTFGQTTDDAMKDALRGETRIFADGIKTATKANMLNQNELARWEAMKKLCESYCDTLRSAIASNKKKAEDYKEAILKYKPDLDLTGASEGSSVTVVVED